MQCLSFCLFDVYGVSADKKIQVQNQSNCKTDCPACSRVCPEVAIMFPKYRHGPINGEEVQADDVRREAMKVDISALLGGDVYSMLRDRSAKAKSRFSKERDDDRALKERQNCLVALKRDLDIPAEVLAALPSPDEIMAKAEAARLRAEAARQPPADGSEGLTMLFALTRRVLTETRPKVVAKFVYNFGVKGVRSVELHKRRRRRGENFPPFLFISVISSCQLRCQGCWVDVAAPSQRLSLDELNRIVGDAKAHGNAYFGILGGEPFMHPQLLDLFAAHPDCYFQVFTNGQLITDEVARRARASWATSRRSSASKARRSSATNAAAGCRS